MTEKEKKQQQEEHSDLGEMEGSQAEDSIYGLASEGGALVGGIYGKGVDPKEAAKHHEGDYLDSGPDQGVVTPCDEEACEIRTEAGADVGTPEDVDEAEEEKPTPEQYLRGGGVYSGGRGTTSGEKP